MDGNIIPIAMAALVGLAGFPGPARAPLPGPEAQARMLASQPMPEPERDPISVSAAERRCLALNIYWEARGEPEAGKAAVAHVTLNRVGAPAFPATICGVVHQGGADGPCQFGWYCDATPDEPTKSAAWDDALAVADRVLAGARDPTGGALYFHGLRERPQWAQARYGRKTVIGQHVFFTVRGAEQVAAER
jgi:N-acetylmuramoyl-L-alanine amidase